MAATDIVKNCYNVNLCGVCQIADDLDLMCTSNMLENGKSCLDMLNYIFSDIVWIDNNLFPLICEICLEKIVDIIDFKELCLHTNRLRESFANPLTKSITETIQIEITPRDIEQPVKIHHEQAEILKFIPDSPIELQENEFGEFGKVTHEDSEILKFEPELPIESEEIEFGKVTHEDSEILQFEAELPTEPEDIEFGEFGKVTHEDSEILKFEPELPIESEEIEFGEFGKVTHEDSEILTFEAELPIQSAEIEFGEFDKGDLEILKFEPVLPIDSQEISTNALFDNEVDDGLKVETLEQSDVDEDEDGHVEEKVVTSKRKRAAVKTKKRGRGRPKKKVKNISPEVYNDYELDIASETNIDPNVLTELNDGNVKMSRYQPQFIPTKKERQCRTCKKIFSSWQSLKKHVDQNHVKLRRYRCDICQMGFTGHDALNRHMYKHNGTRNYVCSVCGLKYITQGDLSEHLVRHDDEAKYACAKCDAKFKTATNLKTHASVHTAPKDYKYLCTVCGSKYPTTGGLSVHMQRHLNARHVPCTKCDKRFYSKTDMARHLVTHSDLRPFKCDLCACAYKLKHILFIHKTQRHGIGNYSHKRSRKYDCTYCEKKFISRISLQRHILTHTGLKPFKCCICDMRFTCKSYLREHLKRKHSIDVDDVNFKLSDHFDICPDLEEGPTLDPPSPVADDVKEFGPDIIVEYDNEGTVEVEYEQMVEEDGLKMDREEQTDGTSHVTVEIINGGCFS